MIPQSQNGKPAQRRRHAVRYQGRLRDDAVLEDVTRASSASDSSTAVWGFVDGPRCVLDDDRLAAFREALERCGERIPVRPRVVELVTGVFTFRADELQEH